MAKRVQSPSSINTFIQCPRKYFYTYIKKLKTAPNIHVVRGSIVHKVLEDIYDSDTSSWTSDNLDKKLSLELQKLLIKTWKNNTSLLKEVCPEQENRAFYFEETVIMVSNFSQIIAERIRQELAKDKTIQQAFKAVTPKREKKYVSQELDVQGFIDAIEDFGENIRLMDYKTSQRTEISEEYRLQLAIYALLYKEAHGNPPNEVGIYFLKNHIEKEKILKVTNELMDFAKQQIEAIHKHTESDHVCDYPKKRSPLCKWRTGQCDFYEMCFAQFTLLEWKKKKEE